MRRGRLALIAAIAVVGSWVATANAEAAVDCTFDAGADTLTVNMSADNDSVVLLVDGGGAIQLLPATVCTGGAASVTTIDTVNIFDNSGAGDTRVDIRQPRSFAPGVVTEEGNPAFSEIEFNIAPGGGTTDVIQVSGETFTDVWRFGNSGLNANVGVGADDLEIFPVGQPDLWILDGGEAGDNLSAQGGNGAGAAYTGAARLDIRGGNGGDVIRGGDSATGDSLEGLGGDDTVIGAAGNDSVGGGLGTNDLDGGAGIDDASFGDANSSTVDLGITGPQTTAPGNVNTLTGLENLVGSDGSDVLIGDAGPNTINGRDGIDVLDGRGGNDALVDAADGATATYAQSPAGVTVDLTAGTATGGAGADTIASGIDNVIGSQFADSLTGDSVANSITGLGGDDTVSALAGSDFVDVRDGGPDTASCGAAEDSAVADQASVDAVNADCEAIAFLPELDPGGGGGNGDGGNGADTEITFDLSGKAKQKVLKQEAVVVNASCPLEDCTATASGAGNVPKPREKLNLKPVTEAVAGGVPEKIKLVLKRQQLRGIARALRAGKKPKVAVSANVTDAAGNAATDSLTVRARR